MNRNSLGTTVSYVLKRMFRGEDYTSATKSVAQELPNRVTYQTVQAQCTRWLSLPGENKIRADDFRRIVRKIMDKSMQEQVLQMTESGEQREIQVLFAALINITYLANIVYNSQTKSPLYY